MARINVFIQGYVVQVFDTDKNEYVSQQFRSHDTDRDYEDSEDGSPVESTVLNGKTLPLTMVQPKGTEEG